MITQRDVIIVVTSAVAGALAMKTAEVVYDHFWGDEPAKKSSSSKKKSKSKKAA